MRWYIILLGISMFIFACSQTELPNPPEIETSVPIGQAYEALNDKTAIKFYEGVCSSSVCSDPLSSDFPIKIKVDEVTRKDQDIELKIDVNAGAVYETAYLLSANGETPIQLDFSGAYKHHPGSDLVNGPVYYMPPEGLSKITKSFTINEANFFPGENILLTFFCDYRNNEYYCNNNKWLASSFLVIASKPDLKIDIESVPGIAKENSKLKLSYKVSNIGDHKAEGYRTKIVFNTETIEEKTNGILNPGESKEFEAEIEVGNSKDDDYVYTIEIDPENKISENDESNNKFEGKIKAVECLKDDKRCYVSKEGTSPTLIQSCGDDYKWEPSKLRTFNCGPQKICSEGECKEEKKDE